MTTNTNVNYTETQVAEIVAAYQAGETVEAIAATLGKSVKSIVAKLASEKVYKAKTTNKTVRTTKADLIAKIAEELDLAPETLQSLEKATKEALEALVSKVVFAN